jgi:hypothetical protein
VTDKDKFAAAMFTAHMLMRIESLLVWTVISVVSYASAPNNWRDVCSRCFLLVLVLVERWRCDRKIMRDLERLK